MTTLLLIRHGESESNAGLPTMYPQSVELTDLGFQQAKYIAYYLEVQVSPNLIVTSPFQRTKQTAALAKSRLPNIPLEIWPVQEFTYLSSKEFPDPTDVQDRKPLVDLYWGLCDPTFVDGPGSESFAQFIERVRGVIKHLKESSYETIAIFSHEQFIRAALWLTQGDMVTPDEETMRKFRDALRLSRLRNGAILRTEYDNSQDRWDWELITSHLLVPVP